MKKSILCCAAAAAFFGGLFCSAANPATVEAESGKVLIVYYSWGGNTRTAAQKIQSVTGGKIFELQPVKAYPKVYRDCLKQARQEINGKVKPELAAKPDKLEQYDVIFAGSPNWLGTMAPPLMTFLSDSVLKGKTIVPFFTNGGGGMQKCESDVQSLCAKSKVLKAATFRGSSIQDAGPQIEKWISESVKIIPAKKP